MTMTDSLVYIVLSVPWAVAGFLAGFTAGVKANLWSRTVDYAPVERPSETASRNSEDAPRATPWYRRGQTWLGTAVAAIGIFTAVHWYSQGRETDRIARDNERLAQCTAAYATGFADALDARADETRRKDEAIDTVFETISNAFGGVGGRPEVEKAFRDYVTARNEQKKAQTEHPLPPAPREVCR